VVVVNLYPFEDKVAKGASFDEALEYVDIGGPTMVRAAAKNFRHVAVVTDPADYPLLLEQLDREGGIDAATRLYFRRPSGIPPATKRRSRPTSPRSSPGTAGTRWRRRRTCSPTA
jgi:hypothetical protein